MFMVSDICCVYFRWREQTKKGVKSPLLEKSPKV